MVAQVGRSLGLLTSATAAALVGAALLSVLLFPPAALALRPWTEQADPGEPDPSRPSLVSRDPAV